MKNEMRVINETGDMKLFWDENDRDEVKKAKEVFDQMVNEKGYLAFRLRRSGVKGEQMEKFDETAERIVLTPPVAGG